MLVKISARHNDVPDTMKTYIENKVAKLTRYFERIQEVQVIIETIKFNFLVEINIISDLFYITAKEQDTDLRATVDKLIHVAERKLKKEKDKIVKVKKHTHDTVRRSEAGEGEEEEEI